MASHLSPEFRLNVLNPGGNDPEQSFAPGLAVATSAHAPVNFHAYAACTGGTFFRDAKRAIAAKDPVLLLLRDDFRESGRALESLKRAGVPVAVSLKETGLQQIAQQLESAARLERFQRIVAEADGCIAPTPEAADVYRMLRRRESDVAYLPTPYPLEDSRWDFSVPIEARHGILVGTREWEVGTRNHAAALLAARRISEATGEPVTVFNDDRRTGRGLSAQVGFAGGRLTVLERRDSYAEYLRTVAQHKIIFQLDTSFVPGQVAGDALLCHLPCVGGNGAIERAAFSELCGAGRSIGELIEIAMTLLQNAKVYSEAVILSQARGAKNLSFDLAAEEMAGFFRRIAS